MCTKIPPDDITGLCEVDLMIPVTYGYAQVSKTDDATRNLETQLHILREYGIRGEHIFADEMTGRSLSRPACNEMMSRCGSATPSSLG